MRLPIALLLFGTAAIAPSIASACKCQESTLGAQYDDASIVFYGTAIESKGKVSLKVQTSWKGTKRNATIQPKMDEKCDFKFEPDTKYLVFANRVGKKIKVDVCSGTTALEFQPFAPAAWTLADQPQYGLTKKEKASQEQDRNNLTSAVSKHFTATLERCHKRFWKDSKEANSGHVELRLDFFDKKNPEVHIDKFETSTKVEGKVKECLVDAMAKGKYPGFAGGPISVRVYRVMDAVDPMMKRDRTEALVESAPKPVSN